MTTTYKGTVITNYIKGLIEDNRTTLIAGGIDAIYYGDQRVIAGGKVVCVEPTRKVRDYKSTGLHMRTDFDTSIIVYVGSGQGVEEVQFTADTLTESIEDLLNRDATPTSFGINGTQLGGLITNGFVSSSEHGYRIPSSQLVRANRLIFRSRTDGPLYIAPT